MRKSVTLVLTAHKQERALLIWRTAKKGGKKKRSADFRGSAELSVLAKRVVKEGTFLVSDFRERILSLFFFFYGDVVSRSKNRV